MSCRWLLFLFCLSLLSLLAPLSRANLGVRVDDASIRVRFDDLGTRVVLPIENSLPQALDARVKLELLDTDGATRAPVARNYQLKSGRNELTVPLALWLSGKAATDSRELLWYRLRYEITPAASSQFDAVSGVISLSEVTPDIFTLNVATSRKAREGSSYRLRVRTAHPLNARPVGNVELNAELKFDGYDRDDIVLRQSARTDASGFATIDFQIPRHLEDDEGDLTITAQRGILTVSAEDEVEINRDTQIMVTSDKPLYQPGQVLHIRVLMFDSTRRALANQSATLTISDPESSKTFRAEITSSRFGVANADWQIPENARLGDYSVEVKLDSDKYEDAYGGMTVKISRYDLPNFTVNVKPDRPFYLSSQSAEVEVRADYLFGQPVKRGHVRVVRETERHWNYREQKYETEEGDKYEGDTDAEGKFVARINLAEEHERLKEEDYSRYRDLTYAAYFTDPTTNRTEQRRFDLRLTKDAIHIYPIISESRQPSDFPLEFYVSASYADGTPASCEVAISRVWDDDERRAAVPLRTVKTNRYGLAKVSGLALPKSDNDDGDAKLEFRARDNQAASGTHVETLYLTDRTRVHVTTDKPLYRDGEPIRAQVISNKADLTLVLDAITEEKVVHSRLVTLRNGRVSIEIPFRREFTGAVTLAAYAPADTDDEDNYAYHARAVLYPRDRDLKLNLTLDQESYRPGQDAVAKFLTRSATGRYAESALGVVIFDRAVEERARTDREFGNFYRPYLYLSNDFGSVAGFSRKDLDRLDLSKPLPEGIDLVAEVMLANFQFTPRFLHGGRYESDAATVFRDVIRHQFDPLKDRLEAEYKQTCAYPTSEEALRHFAMIAGTQLTDLRDPWAMPYRTNFFVDRDDDVLEMRSAGPDKRFDTGDDFTVMRIARPYFRFTGEAIDRAVARFHRRTGRYIRDAVALKNELRQEGIEFDSLRDPWGEPYRLEFGANQTSLQVFVSSSGPDKRFTPQSNDDVRLWTSSIDYAIDLQARIDIALTAYLNKSSQIPQTNKDFRTALWHSGINGDDLRDPWGHPYYVTFSQASVYGDRVSVYSYANYGEKPKQKIDLTPVTQQMNFIYLRSAGQDGKEGTADDFNVATFSRLTTDQAGSESSPLPQTRVVILPGSTGAITGTITDPQGAVIPGAKVSAKNLRTSLVRTIETNENGVYLIKNLPAALYEVSFEAAGFNRTIVTNVVVRSSNVTQLNVTLDVGAVQETVSVSAGSGLLNTENATVSISESRIESLPINGRNASNFLMLAPGASAPQLSTPRLREYFPETLVWQPSLETDKQGRAQLQFKLADNITTWKMSVIGSTEDGQVGAVEREIRSFQPFFVEHDPPRVLTEGDEISLPVVVRNYLDRAQTVNLEIKTESWFTLLGGATWKVDVAAGDSTRGIFDFRASASIDNGKQRITALAADANDAIEKPVTVHPDGEEKSVTASDIVSDQATLTLDIPSVAIPNSARAELKIYPNLLAHVTESVEAIMSRPYGCGEQTISSTYPSLLWLKNYKRLGSPAGSADVNKKATRYLRAGYARLLNYRDESGGFTYWGRGEPDTALTAYALRFLSEASDQIDVDDSIIRDARAWLTRQQRTNGSWAAHAYWDKSEDRQRTAMLTAFVARVLAMTAETAKIDGTSNKTSQQPFKVVGPELKRAFDYLAQRAGEIDEPYLIASYALAVLEVGDYGRAEKQIVKLRALAHEEKGANYWSLETNTPFYGWGLAGRVETSALVVQALARASEPGAIATGSTRADELIDRGLLFLMREKDRYGVWYSTQATINVLDALLSLLARDVNAANTSRIAEIVVNGRNVKSIEMPPPNQLSNPITIDLSSFIQAGKNHVEIKRARGSSPASAQAVATYYLPWRESVATQEANWRANGASGLRLVAKFDKTNANVTDEISCRVEAERVGHRGYGMMLAEIGLPPGADVDRASLETAMKGSDWSISRYDVLPDRVVLYLWPRAGGTKFDFKFKTRFGLNAQSAASIVYDYYNPEARAIVAPVRFVVK